MLAFAQREIALAHPADVEGFIARLRGLLQEGIDPDEVSWSVQQDRALLQQKTANTSSITLPRGFIELLRTVALHDDPQRFARLHRMALAIHRRREVWLDTLSEERLTLERMARQVRREIHKMHAFVRFRPVGSGTEQRHVAWFEPAHHVVQAAAPFFVKRFASMRWAILTPRGCVEWDGKRLQERPPAQRADAPAADAGEALWLAYYQSIFNPARVKIDMMRREMPVRFWKNLPEAASISALIQQAPQRAGQMSVHVDLERNHRRSHACSAPANAASRPLDCDRCDFAAHATQLVWGEGADDARLMLVGEQPGDREDLEGRPFVGPAGQLLREAIAQLGWPSDKLYMTNAVKHFKYQWRGKLRMHKTAAQREIEHCHSWLEAEIQQVKPAAIVALGATAAFSLLGERISVNAHAAQWRTRADGLPVLVAHHPAALLRLPPEQQAAALPQWTAQLNEATAWVW